MDKIETKTKTIEQRYHNFYCDHCGTHLGTSEEYEDGYYHQYGHFIINFPTPQGYRYKADKYLCDQCKEKYLSELYAVLEQFGFKKEN